MSADMFYTRKLGLAAYIKMNGGVLISKTKSEGYQFESDKPLRDWVYDYSNSCCNQHDSTLMELRNMPDEDQ